MRNNEQNEQEKSGSGSLVVLFILIFFIVDLEVPQFIGIMSCSYDSEPISEVVLLEILLR